MVINMRAVVQRVRDAKVTVAGETVGQIAFGLLVLVGIGRGDDEKTADWMADKIAGLRIFEDEAGKMNLSVEDAGGAVLLISQFTLFGDCRKGKRPSFTEAAVPEKARALYEVLAAKIRERGLLVECGKFQAEMDVRFTNTGPVTLLIDSDKLF